MLRVPLDDKLAELDSEEVLVWLVVALEEGVALCDDISTGEGDADALRDPDCELVLVRLDDELLLAEPEPLLVVVLDTLSVSDGLLVDAEEGVALIDPEEDMLDDDDWLSEPDGLTDADPDAVLVALATPLDSGGYVTVIVCAPELEELTDASTSCVVVCV